MTATTTLTTAAGELTGERQENVRIYRNIPYAAPPVGSKRWRAPEPASGWTGVRDGTAFGPDPLQPINPRKLSRAPGNAEDCLTLNIWTPADQAGAPWPVMVWFEGGSFVTGTGASTRCDGAPLAARGVIVVTLNYRLGVFGYLAHSALTAESEHGASGNYGLMDQLAALRWVRENIGAFGGDPGRVTIFGVSAGSASIGLMLTSPLARGLFDQAIMQSPGSLRPLAPLAQAEEAGRVVGDDLAAMRAMPAEELLAYNTRIGPPVRALTTPRILRPIWDGYVVPDDEALAYEGGRFVPVPTIVGCTANEGAWAVGDMPINTVEEYTTYMQRNFNDATGEALALYPVREDGDVKRELALVFGDTQFTYGARGLARAISKRQPLTYRYLFNHGTAGHSDDTSYIFGTETTAVAPDDKMISEAMMRYWVQFATTGNPNTNGLPAWSAFGEAADNFLTFGETAIAEQRDWRPAHLDFIDRYLKSQRS